jgi:hypothetical protein
MSAEGKRTDERDNCSDEVEDFFGTKAEFLGPRRGGNVGYNHN